MTTMIEIGLRQARRRSPTRRPTQRQRGASAPAAAFDNPKLRLHARHRGGASRSFAVSRPTSHWPATRRRTSGGGRAANGLRGATRIGASRAAAPPSWIRSINPRRRGRWSAGASGFLAAQNSRRRAFPAWCSKPNVEQIAARGRSRTRLHVLSVEVMPDVRAVAGAPLPYRDARNRCPHRHRQVRRRPDEVSAAPSSSSRRSRSSSAHCSALQRVVEAALTVTRGNAVVSSPPARRARGAPGRSVPLRSVRLRAHGHADEADRCAPRPALFRAGYRSRRRQPIPALRRARSRPGAVQRHRVRRRCAPLEVESRSAGR